MAVSIALIAFLAASVEMVEALTIVLAVGISRGWRSALIGGTAAIALLLGVVLAFGLTILRDVPMNAMRVGLGLFLLLFGLKWLKKAILRQSGRKPLHAEDAIYAHRVASLERSAKWERTALIDPEGFATAFNGTLLEGLEVALIIVAVGKSSGQLGSAAVGGAAAVVLVSIAGVLLRSPLARVPENLFKYVVGIMLTTFGTFWAGQGLGVVWPGQDVSAIALIVLYLTIAVLATRVLKTGSGDSRAEGRAS